MDAKNRFETRATFFLLRLEWLGGLAVCAALTVRHFSEIRWAVFVGLFAVIDAIGYVPGAVAFRKSRDGRISHWYFVAYNTMHSLVTAGVVAGLWAVLVKPEWALLALPLHLLGDRALFGNSLKPFGVSFEPDPHPAYADFERQYSTSTGREIDASRRGTDAVRL
ncbi:hypothetical protein A6P39_040805 [Streptomyces sp. FXJ1.172]|uniref:hypothetical protein n=1 Tax=Streptomyces sp. FXJ1.172 TaxID=710705 RepID=UPI0007D019C0|nr:hypothetical protein [Streptomyces sp. FXJ1.172]WEO99868.1 hypothetical protein A6P39_040805 [Streptomyces sp. FXJ1.172]